MKQTSARERFISDFEILSRSGIGVILTRTREPHRAEDALRMWAFEHDRKFRSWNAVRGWLETVPESTKGQRPVADKLIDPYIALKRINDVDGGGTNAWQDTLCAMHYPHWVLPKMPAFIQCVKEYARDFTESKQRLVLLTPEGFVLPVELQNDIAVLDFDLPSRGELREIYGNVLESVQDSKGAQSVHYTDAQVDVLLGSGSGMTEFEFETALSKAFITHKALMPNVPLEKVNEVMLETKTDVVKRSEVLELMEPVNMKDVAGLDLAKEWIGKRKKCFSDAAKDFGVDVPKGICAIGPPGTGKTLFAKAIASVLQVPLIRFDVGKVFGGIVGQSEERSRSSLKQIDAMAPCVVLIDEIDKAGIDPRQGGGDSGVSKRVMGAILTHMQETKAPVFWVLTANRVDGLPPELLRKGRLDEVFAVLPPNATERLEVVKIHLRKRKQDPAKIKGLDAIVTRSEGFVSAELEAAVKEAVVEAYDSNKPVTAELIVRQLEGMKPISEAFAEDFTRMREWAESNARMASTPEEQPEPEHAFRTRTRRRALDNN